MTRALLAGAILATAADGLAFLVWIVPGFVVETNPLIAGASSALVLAGKAVLVGVLIALTAVIEDRRAGVLRFVLVVAIATGAVGFASTVISLS